MKKLIENFIAGINDVDDVLNEWHEFVVEQRDQDLNAIITEERLKPEDTRKFMENAFRDGEIKTAGTDIDKLMPPLSRFGGGGRAKKKQGVIDKLKNFFEKYFGIKTYFEIISAKPTHIFYYHSRYFVFFYCFYHLLKPLSIKGCSTYSVIGIVIDIYKAVSFSIAFK